MEIDELKKSWSVLNEQLSSSKLVNEQIVNSLIMERKSKANSGINKIAGWGKFSLLVGVVMSAACVFFCILLPKLGLSAEVLNNIHTFLFFLVPSLVLGFWWDLKCYMWVRDTNIEEMSILTVVGRMNKFKLWTRNEIVAVAIWIAIALSLVYYLFEFYTLPLISQVVMVSLWIILLPITGYLIYKKLIYDNLDEVKRNIAEINELKID